MGIFLYSLIAVIVAFAFNIGLRVYCNFDPIEKVFIVLLSCIVGFAWPITGSLAIFGGLIYFFVKKSDNLVERLRVKFNPNFNKHRSW